jgi:tricorn protease
MILKAKNSLLKGHGVEPDYVVDNDPAKEYAGEDQQLNKAIELILEDLKTNPANYQERPLYPKK